MIYGSRRKKLLSDPFSTPTVQINLEEAFYGSLHPQKIGPVIEKDLFDCGTRRADNLACYWFYGGQYQELGHLDFAGYPTQEWYYFHQQGINRSRPLKIDWNPVSYFFLEDTYTVPEARGWIFNQTYRLLAENLEAWIYLYDLLQEGYNLHLVHQDFPTNSIQLSPSYLRFRIKKEEMEFSYPFLLACSLYQMQPEDF